MSAGMMIFLAVFWFGYRVRRFDADRDLVVEKQWVTAKDALPSFLNRKKGGRWRMRI